MSAARFVFGLQGQEMSVKEIGLHQTDSFDRCDEALCKVS
jgi:hypothetical protein